MLRSVRPYQQLVCNILFIFIYIKTRSLFEKIIIKLVHQRLLFHYKIISILKNSICFNIINLSRVILIFHFLYFIIEFLINKLQIHIQKFKSIIQINILHTFNIRKIDRNYILLLSLSNLVYKYVFFILSFHSSFNLFFYFEGRNKLFFIDFLALATSFHWVHINRFLI